ncbi:MAG: type II toxin-antitoxin system VapC family toxin [Candidatus Rokubacteria bacterium]|nr:type II toxin-antitoxin system VapC family toxin [Candidatus Rokubacteria bacterium]
MAAEPALVDTNVLLEATDEHRAHHADAVALLESVAPLTFSSQVVREYLAVATRPVAANGLGLSTVDALANIREFRRTVRLLPEERPILATFLALLARVPCTGTRVHDAHIVATALVHRVRAIVSLNLDDFRPFASEVGIVTPVQALRTLAEARQARARRRRTPRSAGGP